MPGIGGSFSKSKSKSQGIFNFQKKFLKKKLLPQFATEYNQPDPEYRGTADRTIGLSLKGLENAAGDPNGVVKTGGLARDRLNQMLSGGEQFGDYFKGTVSDPLIEQYRNEILPQTKAGFLDDLSGSQANLAVKTGENRLLEVLAREKARTETEGLFQALGLANQGAANIDVRGLSDISEAAMNPIKLLEEIRQRRREALLEATLGGGGFSKSSSIGVSGSASVGGK